MSDEPIQTDEQVLEIVRENIRLGEQNRYLRKMNSRLTDCLEHQKLRNKELQQANLELMTRIGEISNHKH